MVLLRWSLLLALRDARAGWRRLLVFALSIALGVAGLVAITGTRDLLKGALEAEAKAVLGADLELASRSAFSEEAEAFFREIGGEQAREVNLSTLAFFPGPGEGRLVQLRALEGRWPFFGRIELEPEEVLEDWRGGRAPGALVERSLLLQLGVPVGGEIRLGDRVFPVAGALVASPGEAAGFGTIAPRVYLPLPELESTGLLREGSFARYKQYFRLEGIEDVESWLKPQRERLRELRLATETVQERQRELGTALEQVAAFLGMAGFVALLLGAVGVASALHLHVRPKLPSIAMLRCLGAPAGAASRVFLWQGMALGAVGSLAGVVIGILVQLVLPAALAPVLPVKVEAQVSWSSAAQGFASGWLTALVFSLWPLLGLKQVSPLRALRAGFGEPSASGATKGVLGVVTLALLVTLAVVTSGSLRTGLIFTAGVAAGSLVLVAAALAVTRVAKRLGGGFGSYVWRQGVANLHRPQNRTVLLVTGLGLGLFLVLSLFLVRGALLAEFDRATSADRPNLVIWDIQQDQREAVEAAMREAGVAFTQAAPVVTMRIQGIDGRTVAEIQADRNFRAPGWRLRREYRSTFRAGTTASERVISGSWVGTWSGAEGARVPISVEEEMARELGLGLGSRIDWDVQGQRIETEVASIRKVEWRGFSPNFFVVFPAGVLEDAPGFWLMAGKAEDTAQSAGLQRVIGRTLPGVSIIDLQAVLRTFDTITRQIGRAVSFMAAFTVLTALIVLVGALIAGRNQRAREAVLLRTLGARRGQVARIEAVEYAVLGSLAALVGGGLSWVAAALLGRFVFKLQVLPPVGPVAAGWLVVVGVTLLLGWLTGRAARSAPPLEVLRSEGRF
jgi:putative ABC transport system permease protein